MPQQNITKILSDEKMRDLGFTDRMEQRWFYSKSVGEPKFHVALTITISKTSGGWSELVEDLDFGQPFFYMGCPIEKQVKEDIKKQIAILNKAGLSVAVNDDEYSVRAR